MTNRTSLERRLNNARRVLDALEEQASGFSRSHLPVELKINLEDQRKDVADLEAQLSQLPTKSQDITEYIAKRGHLIHKLKGKDSTGRWAYYFVLVESELEQAFLEALKSNKSIDLEDYGKVVASSYGESPNQEVKAMLKEKYGFIV